MSRLTDSGAHSVLDSMLGSSHGSLWAATVYVGLSSTEPAADGTGATEPSGDAYARVAVSNNSTNWPAASGRQKSNGAAVTFPTPTGDGWGAVNFWTLHSAATAGTLLGHGSIAGGGASIGAGTAPSFAAGTLIVTVPA